MREKKPMDTRIQKEDPWEVAIREMVAKRKKRRYLGIVLISATIFLYNVLALTFLGFVQLERSVVITLTFLLPASFGLGLYFMVSNPPIIVEGGENAPPR